jgi:DNA-binding NarL/FixJ family response regulator
LTTNSTRSGRPPWRTASAIEAHGLTRREEEILYLIGEGLANTEIADALALSRKTVETHRTKLGQKLGIPTRSGLIHFALNEFQGGGAR